MAEGQQVETKEVTKTPAEILRRTADKANEIESLLSNLKKEKGWGVAGFSVREAYKDLKTRTDLLKLTQFNVEMRDMMRECSRINLTGEYSVLNREMSHDIYAVFGDYHLVACKIGLADLPEGKALNLDFDEAERYDFALDPAMLRLTGMIVRSFADQIDPFDEEQKIFDLRKLKEDVVDAFKIRHQVQSMLEEQRRGRGKWVGGIVFSDENLVIDAPALVFGNENDFARIIANTIGNSTKAVNTAHCLSGEAGEIYTKVTINRVGTGNGQEFKKEIVELEISDNGNGLDLDKALDLAVKQGKITQDDVNKMTDWEKCVWVHKIIYEDDFSVFAEGKEGGTGTGLTIVKKLIEAAGGHVISTPNPKGGFRTIFGFDLVRPKEEMVA